MPQVSLFDDISRPGKDADVAIAKKSNSKAKKAPVTVKGNGLLDQINYIRNFVEEHLGKYKDRYICIRDMETLHSYIDRCLDDRRIALDTETTGLNVFKDKIVGISLHSRNNKGAYIPINHTSYDVFTNTFKRIENQLTVEQIRAEFERLSKVNEVDMFNAPFDRRVIKHNLGIWFPCTWDCSLGAKMLNENEPKGMNKLKPLHSKYVLNGAESEFSFDELFDKIGFDKVPIDIATLYAGHDATDTTELSDFQRQYIYYDENEPFEGRNGMNGVSWCFFNIEMPCVDATIEMEENGVVLDLDYQKELSEKYHKMEQDVLNRFYESLAPYEEKLESLRMSGVKIDRPINVNSPKQLAILIYDVLKEGVVDKRSPRGTGEEILTKLNNPITNILLEYRGIEKLIGTYIDKMPNCLEEDNRVHCKFNQYGAKTGRFSSSEPNMQNIPAKNKDIRKMFVASEGCLLLSSDYSQQEPKCLAAMCRIDGDDQLYNTFMAGRQVYADIASIAFHKPYEDCLEFYLDENGNETTKVNKEGKERRARAKKILLASLYGMGEQGIANDLEISLEEATKIKNAVYKGVPAIPKFEKKSLDFARENGYVTTIGGRKRRLPDLMLNEYEFKWLEPEKHIDILSFDDVESTDVPDDICDMYWDKLHQCNYKYKHKIFEEANKKHGVWIIDNGSKIAESTRQCVNSRIQGSAADLTKLAMIELFKNERLKELGFKLLIQVHDELIGECPEENVKECAELLTGIMSKAAERLLQMPIKCDVDIMKEWSGEKLNDKFFGGVIA